jgi:hypothetical protein
VRVLDSHEDDWALLLARCTPGTALREDGLADVEHLRVGAELIVAMVSEPAPVAEAFPTLAQVDRVRRHPERADRRLVGSAPIPLDLGLLVDAVVSCAPCRLTLP